MIVVNSVLSTIQIILAFCVWYGNKDKMSTALKVFTAYMLILGVALWF